MNQAKCELRTYSTKFDSHLHRYSQLIMPLSGSLMLTTESIDGEVDANKVALVASQDMHEFRASSSNQFVVVDLPKRLELLHQHEKSKLINIEDHRWSMLRNLFYEEVGKEQHKRLNPLIEYAMALIGSSEKSKAIDYMKNNLAMPISVAELANVEGYSESYFSAWFTERFRISPMKYLLHLRLEEAKKRLVLTDESILMVGMSVGYEYQASFSRAFKIYQGVSPNTYRKMNRKCKKDLSSC